MRWFALVFFVSPLLVGIAGRRPIFAAPSSTIPPSTLAPPEFEPTQTGTSNRDSSSKGETASGPLPEQHRLPAVAPDEQPRQGDGDSEGGIAVHQYPSTRAEKSESAQQKDYARENLAIAKHALVINRRLVCVTSALGGFAAFIGLLQAAIFWKQVTTTRQVERPWLLPKVEFPDWKHPDTPPFPLPLHWSVTNHGKGPALLKRAALGLSMMTDDEMKGEPPFETTETTVALPLAPNGIGHHGNRYPYEDPIGLELFKRGERTLVVVGEVEYEDVWGIPHLSRFCFSWRFRNAGTPQRHVHFRADGPEHWTRYT